MRPRYRLLAAPLLVLASVAHAAENRCGILSNPTPGNWWLADRDGEWVIGVQGGYQAEGMENMPEELFATGWVRTNGSYGYRCACLSLDRDRKTMRIRPIAASKALPMRKCTADRALAKALRAARAP